MRTVHLLIRGKVQGVFYRATAREVAEALGLQGWVRNLPDGAVEALAQGPAEKVASFIEWCHKGPRNAVVASVDVSESTPATDLDAFEVRREK